MSVILVTGKDRDGFLRRLCSDPRLKKSDIGLVARLLMRKGAAVPTEELDSDLFGPEKQVRVQLRTLKLLGYCTETRTLSRAYQDPRCQVERRQRNTLFFTINCDKGEDDTEA